MFVRPALIDKKKHAHLYGELSDDQKGDARLKVLDVTRRDVIPDEGREVPEHHYWHRRLRDGDVVLCTEDEEAALKEAADPTPAA
jgi:hypothetical protein